MRPCDKIAVQLHDISKKAKPFSAGMQRRVLNTDGVTFCLDDETSLAYDAACKAVMDNSDCGARFSEKYVEGKVRAAIACLLKEGVSHSRAATLAADLVKELDAWSEENIVYIPLSGISMEVPTLAIGNILIKTMSDEEYGQLKKTFAAIMESSTSAPQDKQAGLRMMERSLDQNIRGQVCAEIKVVAEPARAQERAETDTRRVIDLLRYSIPALYSKGEKVNVGLGGEVLRERRDTPVISTNKRQCRINMELVGSLVPFTISARSMRRMEELGVFKLAALHKKHDSALTAFERTILRAVHWFASAQAQCEPENAFLNLVTCLEVTLTPEDGNPIGTALAEGAALVIGDTLERRTRIKALVKTFYGKRSAVSHGGQKAILDSELVKLQNIVGTLVVNLVARMDEFQTKKALLDWVERQKLGGTAT